MQTVAGKGGPCNHVHIPGAIHTTSLVKMDTSDNSNRSLHVCTILCYTAHSNTTAYDHRLMFAAKLLVVQLMVRGPAIERDVSPFTQECILLIQRLCSLHNL